jgi:hypothetical protein
MKVYLDEESVIKANAQFWEQMLTMKLETAPPSNSICMETEHMVGVVLLDGVWKGRIEVRIGLQLAYEATAAMMMQARETVQSGDVLDAIKEIANMLAGTIKSSLPRPCSMSVPESTMEAAGICFAPRTDDSLSVGFSHAFGGLLVRIREQDEEGSLSSETAAATCPILESQVTSI